MLKILQFIKNKCGFLWELITWGNGMVFSVLYGKRFERVIKDVLREEQTGELVYRKLIQKDIEQLLLFFQHQPETAFTFFKPHPFDEKNICRLLRNRSFLMFGVFAEEEMVGYFFLRCFVNKSAFRGKIVDVGYRGRGIAKTMGKILSEICFRSKFRLFATISKDNYGSLASSKAVNEIRIIKKLPDDYLYVEYLKK